MDNDWLKRLMDTWDYCKYDMKLECVDPNKKDCENCKLNPDNLVGAKT